MSNPKKLFLLDAFALIYRAYFAFIKNPRINSKGLNTSAIFGFTNTLIEVINKQNPTHLAVVFDTKKPTQRHIDFPAYKAHREAMPEGISEALPYIDKLLEAMNIPKLYRDGFEADDVIGTLAKKAEQEGFQVYMMTSDKDFAQLVSENIFMYRPGNKWQPTTVLGIPEVLEKFEIQKVDQVIDFLGMMGDTSDNIPGIPGVGKKTAQKFIAEFGSMEDLFENTHKLKGKMKEKVESAKEIGLQSKQLVTIITDVPIDFYEQDLRVEKKDEDAIKSLFDELEFRALLPRVLASKSNNQEKEVTSKEEEKTEIKKSGQMNLFTTVESEIKKSKSIPNNYKTITNFEKAKELVTSFRKNEKFAIQLCCSSTDFLDAKVLGISLCCEKENAKFIFISENELISLLQTLLQKEQIMLIGNNLKSQIKVLTQNNINVKAKLFDVGIAHYLLHPDMRHDLSILTENYLHYSIGNLEDLRRRGKLREKIANLDKEDLSNFSNQQVDAIWQLYHIFSKQLEEIKISKLFTEIEMPLLKVLVKMEMQGFRIDAKMLSDYAITLLNEIEKISKEIIKLSGEEFNIASPKQLGEVLFEKMKLVEKAKKTRSGQYSTSEETLLKLKDKHPIIEQILEYREIKKLLSTYIIVLPELINHNTKRIHTTFNQSVAATGRLSSINPNLQNIPIRTVRGRKTREAFVPRDDNFTLLSADYSQIELRIMASMSKDEGMLKAFNDGVDIHAATAAKVYKVSILEVDRSMRSNAKSVNFGIIYGISAFGLSQNIGVSRTEAKQIIDGYFKEFPKIKEYMDFSIEKARENEFVATILGRRRYLKEINSRNGMLRAMAERNAINAPIQGSAADIIKKAMIDVQSEIEKQNLKSKMLLQVHDELVFDMHKDEENLLKDLVKRNMENAVELDVPIIVDLGIGNNWLEAH
ncbi:MAG: DNA polymerase I [Flavobacteriales bacterium]|jgi:DNA polymerase-1|nr:DNA polymerase I [Flavobacteriales bacterium]HJN63814.1 DNA polymerase I [Flavobacteriales bacterium]|tara:strand:+ start:10799 stop:13573 length:2775 start_codon:yes stop_codon:yes gene_type:complete